MDKPFTPCIFFKKKIISNWADQINTADTISQIAERKEKNVWSIAYPTKGGFSYHLRVNVSESEWIFYNMTWNRWWMSYKWVVWHPLCMCALLPIGILIILLLKVQTYRITWRQTGRRSWKGCRQGCRYRSWTLMGPEWNQWLLETLPVGLPLHFLTLRNRWEWFCLVLPYAVDWCSCSGWYANSEPNKNVTRWL